MSRDQQTFAMPLVGLGYMRPANFVKSQLINATEGFALLIEN